MKLIGELLKWGYSEARVQQINFKFYLHVFTSCIDICTDICLQVLQVGTRCHLFTSWYMLSLCGHLFTSWYTLSLCGHLFTSCYTCLQCPSSSRITTFGNDVSPRLDITFGNDVALHKTLHKNRLEIYITYYCHASCLVLVSMI